MPVKVWVMETDRGSPLHILVPLHVSGLWIPVYDRDLRRTGSLGAGVTLDLYVETRGYTTNECFIRVNNDRVLSDHASYICGRTGFSIGVFLYTPIELGTGFGVSAASVLAHALLISHLVDGDRLEYASLAHEAEVKYNTGLGDVIAEYYGGLEIRVKPGAPGVGSVAHIPIHEEDMKLVACRIPGYESTPSMLKRIDKSVYDYGYTLWRKLLDDPLPEKFFEYSQLFTRRIFDYRVVDELLMVYRGYINGYYRKKNALIIWCESSMCPEIRDYLMGQGLKCYETRINSGGVKSVYSTQSST